MSARRNTIEPSGLLISLVALRQIAANSAHQSVPLKPPQNPRGKML
jgi:hypothetical protein